MIPSREHNDSIGFHSLERYPGVASAPLPATYRRGQPEKSVLYTVVRDLLETFLEQARQLHGEGYPWFIEREFRRYLGCGIISRGFVPEAEDRLIFVPLPAPTT